MHILAAFAASIANGTTYGALSAVSDQALTVSSNNRYILPARWRARLGYVQGVNLTAAQIDAPSLRNLALPEIYPTVVAAAPPTTPGYVDWGDTGPMIQQNEEVTVRISRGGADAQPVTAGLWLSPGMQPAPGGMVTTLVATATIVQVASNWVSGALTFATTVPAGQYAVIGMNVVANDVAFARLIFPGQSQWRPGCLVDAAYGNKIIPNVFRAGRLGLWGHFWNTAQPQIETFGLVAGSEAVTAYIDVIKVQ